MSTPDEFTVPVPSPMEQMDAIAKRHGDGRHMRFPWQWDLPAEPSGMEKAVPFRTTYRSLRDGKLWCESIDPDEVLRSGGDALEVMRHYVTTRGWEPWNPDEIRPGEVSG